MKVVIDPAIRDNAAVLQAVREGNSALERMLDLVGDKVEVSWAVPHDRPELTSLTIRSLDEVPAEVSSVMPLSILTSAMRRDLEIGGTVSRWADQRFLFHHRRLNQLLADAKD